MGKFNTLQLKTLMSSWCLCLLLCSPSYSTLVSLKVYLLSETVPPNVFSMAQTATIYLNVVQCKSCFDSREKDNDFHKKGFETCTNNHSAAQGGPLLYGPYANVAVSIYIQAAVGFLWWLCTGL